MKRAKWKRFIAMALALLMLISLCTTGNSGLYHAFADGPKTIDTSWDLTVGLKVNGVEATNPDVIYQGDELAIDMEYTIPDNNMGDGQVYTYQMPKNIVFTQDYSGSIIIPAGSTGFPEGGSAGTYQIDHTTGLVTFTISDEVKAYNMDGGQGAGVDGIPIPIQFKCNAVADLSGDAAGSSFSFPGYTGGTLYIEPPLSSTGIKAEKSMAQVADADGNIPTNITISVPDGKTGSKGTINFTDDFSDKNTLDFVAGSLTLKKVTGSGETALDVSQYIDLSSIDSRTFTASDLPQLSAGESYVISYKLKSNLTGNQDRWGVTNRVNVTSAVKVGDYIDTDNQDTVSASSSINLASHVVAKRGAFNDAKDTIHYLITFNGPHSDLNGMTLRDIIDYPAGEGTLDQIKGRVSNLTVTATDATGAEVTGNITASNAMDLFTDSATTGGIQIGASDTNTYVVEYDYTPMHTNSPTDLNFDNHAAVDDNRDDGNVVLPGFNPQEKGSNGMQESGDTLLNRYALNIRNSFNNGGSGDAKNAEVPAGSYTDDVFANEPAGSNFQYIDSENFYTVDGTNYIQSVKYWDPVTSSYVDSFDDAKDADEKVYGVRFVYNAIPYGASFRINYTVKVDKKDLPLDQEVRFKNTATYNYEYDNTPLTDTDTTYNQNYTRRQSLYKFAINAAMAEGSRKTEGIKLNYPNDTKAYFLVDLLMNESMSGVQSIVDTLPTGCTYDASSLKVYFTGKADEHTYSTTEIGSGFVTADTSAAGKVTFSFTPEAFLAAMQSVQSYQTTFADKRIRIQYAVTLPTTEPDDAVNHIKTFSNTAEYEGDIATATQPVEYGHEQTGLPEVKKTALDPESTIKSEDTTFDRSFRIVINPDGLDLDPSKNIVTLSDTITFKAVAVENVSLKEIHLYAFDLNATDYKGASLDASLVYTDNTSIGTTNYDYSVNYTLPDETPLVLEYTYEVVRTGTNEGTIGNYYVGYSNHVNLTGNHGDSVEEKYFVADTWAGSNLTRPNVNFYKVDSSNYALRLEGATFKLQKAVKSGESYEFRDVTSLGTFTLGAEGMTIRATLDPASNEVYNATTKVMNLHPFVIYRLQEQDAPSGYTKGGDVSFVISDQKSREDVLKREDVKKPIEQNLVSLNSLRIFTQDSDLNVGNTRDTRGSVQILKKWKDSDGNEIAKSNLTSADSATVKLYQVGTEADPNNSCKINIYNRNANGNTLRKSLFVKKQTAFSVTIALFDYSGFFDDSYWEVGGVQTPIASGAKSFIFDNGGQPLTGDVDIYFYQYSWGDQLDLDQTVVTTGEADTVLTDPVVYGTYTLDNTNQWVKTIGNVPSENNGYLYYYYLEETDPSTGVVTTYTNKHDTVPLWVNGTDSYAAAGGVLTVTNQKQAEETTSFKIKKILDTSAISGQAVEADVLAQEFPITFTLTAAAGKTLPTSVDVEVTHADASKTTSSVALTAGVGTVTLKAGETAEIKGLPLGTTYKVTETADAALTAAGFTYDATAVGATGYTGDVADDGTTKVEVTNGYTLPIQLEITKTVVSALASDKIDKEFTFTVTLNNGAINGTYGDLTFTNGVATVSLKDGEKAEVGGLPAGTGYLVVEAEEDTFTTTAQNNTGEITTTKTTIPFTNTRKGSFKISKAVTGNGNAIENTELKNKMAGTYTFKVYTDEDCTVPYQQTPGTDLTVTVTVPNTGATATSAEVTNVLPGEYWIKETAPTNGSVPVVNPVHITVGAGKVGTQAVVAPFTNDYEYGEINFTKDFTFPDGVNIQPSLRTGLTYELRRQGQVVKQFTYYDVYYALSTGHSCYTISNLPLADDYVLVETNPNIFLNDYNIVLNEAASTISKDSIAVTKGHATDVNLNNVYKKRTSEVVLQGVKTVNGAKISTGDALDGQFTFTLHETTTGTVSDKLTDDLTASNAASGIQFDAISYTAPGVHTYRITEAAAVNQPDVAIDPVIYDITVTVAENPQDTTSLTANVTAATKTVGDTTTAIDYFDGQNIVFDNTLEEKTGFKIAKTLTTTSTSATVLGQAFPISFVLTAPAGKTLPDAVDVTITHANTSKTNISVALSGGAGSVTLKRGEMAEIKDLPQGTTYKVTETADAALEAKGFTYDATAVSTDGYAGTVADDGSTVVSVVNGYTMPVVSLDVSKIWDDGNDAAGLRPESIDVNLKAGTAVSDTAKLEAGNQWHKRWSDLPKYDSDLQEIVYSVEEDAASVTGLNVHYDLGAPTETATSGEDAKIYTITNTLKTGDLKVSKKVVSDLSADSDEEFNFTVTLTGSDLTGAYGGMNFTDGVAVVTLKKGQSVTATGLPAGVAYTVTETPNVKFNTTKTGDADTISDTEMKEAEFTNTRLVGSLEVKKEVVSPSTTDKQTDFTFTVTLSDTTINGTSGAVGDYGVEFENGVATFTLKHGEEKTIQNLPVEVDYTVEETAVDGFVTIKTDDTGTINTTVSTAVFTNTAVGNLIVGKEVASPLEADKTIKFDFKVTLDDDTISGTYGDLTFTNGVAETQLASGEIATAEGLRKGIGYTVEETANELFTTTTSGETGTIGDEPSIAVFTNTRKTGKLTVSKTLVSDLAADATKDFEFTVTLDDTTVNGIFGDMLFTDGVATVTLKGGESAVATGLPTGISYTVTEAEDDEYTTQASADTGTIDVSAAGCTAAFTNTRKTGDLKVSKTLVSDRAADADQEFTFTVTLSDSTISGTYGEMAFTNGVATFKMKGGDIVTAAGLPFTVGYTVTEADAPGFTVSKTGDTGSVPADAAATAVFTNTRKTGSLKVSKTVVSSTASDKQTAFTFTVTLGDNTINGTTGATGDDYGVAFLNGVATFTLKDGESKTIQNLPTEITYTVTEAAADGFATTKTGDTGTISEDLSEAKFTNKKDEGGLIVSKSVVSPLAADHNLKFAFTVTLDDDTINGTYGDLTFTNGVAEVELADGETATATGLPKGINYTVTETANNLFTTTKTDDTGTIGDTASSAEFTNTRKTGKLTVSKTLVSDLAADASKDFSFTVTLGDNTITGTYGDMAFTDGVATFTLKGGESKAAEGLPAGISYTVAETEDPDNFTTDKTNATGTIDSESDMAAGFTNTRKTGDLKVSKTLVSDRAADADQEFTFTVALADTTISGTYGEMTFTNGVATFTLKGGQDVTAAGLPFTVGYTVTEADAAGFTVSKTGDTGSVPADAAATAVFTNTRKTGTLEVSKTVFSSTASDLQKDFSFTVTLSDTTINGTTGATGAYGVEFTDGVATFTLKDGEKKTIQNLPTDITYTVAEAAADGFITTKNSGYTGNISETKSEAKFTNIKDEGGLNISKTVVSPLAADHNLKFAFTVTLDDDTMSGTYGDLTFTNGVAEVELADGETATSNGLPKGINYTVTETANNLFTTTMTGDTGTIGDTASSAEFTNTRKIGKLTVSKTLVSDLAADASKEFSFTVTLGDNTITGTYGGMAFTDGVATFTLKGGESAVATGLPVGIDYSVVESEDTVNFTTQKTGDIGTIDVSAEGCTAAFTNTRKTGDLKVSKTLVSDRAADADQVFNFTVTLSDTTISGTYGGMTFENGVASIALKGGEDKTAAGLPSTVEYTVAETADSNFTTTDNGTTGSIAADETANAVFTNTRKTGSLEVSKSVVSSDASDKQKEFTFTVTLSDTTINGTAGIAGDLYGVEFVNGVATFTLKDSESKTIENLPTGIDYTVEETAAAGFITTFTSDTGTISGTKSEAKFTNTREEGGLVIGKTVVSPLPADSDESFDFTVTLGDDTVNGTYGGLTFINGVAEVSLKHGETASATGLPKNTTFAVAEDTPDRYTAAWTNQTGTIGDDTVTVTCTNTRNTGSLKVTKAVVSKVAADADTDFTFIVTLDNNTVNGTFSGVVFTNGSGTFTLKKGESKVIEGLPTGVGYTVTEGAAANTNFTCVATGNTGTIGDVQAEAVFTNTRKPGQLTVSKTVVSPETSDGDKKFTFTITLDDQTITGLYGNLIFSQGVATVQMKGGESVTATGLPSGTGYKVTETAVTGFDISYADAEGTIMNDAAASAVVTNNRQVGRMTISKTFAIPNGVNVSETDKEALTFQIKRGDTVYHTFTYADFTSGSYETPDLPTYDDYTVVETNADSILATYYLVLDETDSKIQEANVAVTKNQKTPVALRNSYKKAQGTIALKAYKTLDDQAIAAGSTFDGQFNFRLEETTNGDVPDKLTQAMNKTNAGSEVAFDAITYTVPAVHEYTITETVPVALPNIASDATEYVVEVTVTQDASDPAKMNAVVTGVTKNDGTTTTHPAYNAGQGVAFNNIEIVEASPVSMTAGLTKLYKDMYNADKAMTAGQFGFTLTSIPYNGVTDSVQGRAERTAENKKNGSVDFGTFTYTSADAGKTYAYLIAETDPAADTAALDMDETKYILTVEVVETQPNPGKYQLHLNKQWYLAPTGTVADIVDGNKKAEADVKLVNRDRSGILKITKTIKGDITPEEAAGQLQFTVTDENGNVLVVKDGSREKRLENLILEKDFTKVGDIYELEVRVPAGQKYVVSEVIYDVDGAVLESVKANGQVIEKEDGIYSVITESVQPDDTTVAAYEDNYKKGSIVITKTIKGDVTPEEAAGQLEFTIVNETTGETKVVNLSEFTFDETTKTYSYEMEARPGDVYTITETDYDVDGMILESVSHKVNAGESEDGASVTGVVVQLTGQTRVDFEDDYRKDQGVIKFTKYAYVSELCSATPKKTAPLEGVVFQAVDVTNKKNVYEATSDKNGQVKFETMPAGTYEIREVEVPDNIVKSNAVYLAVIENESFTGLTKKDGTPVEKNRIINDQVRADITFTKVSEKADSTVLAGSLYGLFRVLDDGTEEKIAERVTDKDGVVVFRGVLPDTKYLVRELESPDGYYVSKNPLIIGFKVAVGADGSKMAVTDVDVLDTGDDTVIFDENGNMIWLEPEILLQVKKLDPDGKNLAGAKLQIEDMDGNVVVPAWTTTGEISEISGKLVVGREYRLVEVEAPEGYEIAGPVTFTVKNEKVGPGEDKVITITMIDEKEKEEVPPSPPKTNDDSPILPVAGLMALSLAGITVVSSKKRKDKRNK